MVPLLPGEGWGEVMKCPRSTLCHLPTSSSSFLDRTLEDRLRLAACAAQVCRRYDPPQPLIAESMARTTQSAPTWPVW